METETENEKGFIALISVLIVSSVLFGMVLSLAQFGIVSRYGILDLERKIQSEKLAETCVEYAQVLVFNDPSYEVDTPLDLPIIDTHCTVVRIEKSGNTSTVKAQGASDHSYTNLMVDIDSRDGTLTSWQEVTSF